MIIGEEVKTRFMSTMDKKTESVKALQAELDHRTEVENRAIQLISECRFQEADNLGSSNFVVDSF